MEVAVERHGAGYVRAATARSFLPDERLDLIDALAAFTIGLGVREPPGRATPARSRSASSPTWPCSTATCSTAGAGAIGDARVVGTFVEGVAVYEDAGARRLSGVAGAGPRPFGRHGHMTMSVWHRTSM